MGKADQYILLLDVDEVSSDGLGAGVSSIDTLVQSRHWGRFDRLGQVYEAAVVFVGSVQGVRFENQFANILYSAPWQNRETVRVGVKRQDDAAFTFFDLSTLRQIIQSNEQYPIY